MLFHALFPDECNVRELEQKYIIDIHEHPQLRFGNPKFLPLIKSHFPYHPGLPPVQATKQAIYLIRHPIDVMMSAWDFDKLLKGVPQSSQSPEFRAYVRKWVESGGHGFERFGTWVQHVRSWLMQREIPVHLVRYEDLVRSPEQELPKILDFLQAKIDPERQRFAIERSSMKSMQAFEANEVQNKVEGIFFRGGLSKGYAAGNRFVNKGYTDSYRTVLTAEDRAIANRTFGAELSRFYPESLSANATPSGA